MANEHLTKEELQSIPAHVLDELDNFYSRSIRPRQVFVQYCIMNHLHGAVKSATPEEFNSLPLVVKYITERMRETS